MVADDRTAVYKAKLAERTGSPDVRHGVDVASWTYRGRACHDGGRVNQGSWPRKAELPRLACCRNAMTWREQRNYELLLQETGRSMDRLEDVGPVRRKAIPF